VVHRLVRLAPAPVARRQAAASAVVPPTCATARPRERLLRKSRAAASGQEAKVKVREVSSPRASVHQPSAPLRLCRRNVLLQRSLACLQALRRRDRALLLRRGRDRNRRQPPVPRREQVARHREAAAGAKNRGNRRMPLSRRSLQCSTADGRIAARKQPRAGRVSARARVTALRTCAARRSAPYNGGRRYEIR
jgi:hypothetical protein